MKRIFLILVFVIVGINSYAQTADVYVMFTNQENDRPGVVHWVNDNFNRELYRCPSHFFIFRSREKGYSFKFRYSNSKSSANNPIIEKPLSYLNEIDYIDWDEISPCLNKDGAKANVDYILSHEKIYFIDRADIKDGKIFLIPVRELKSAY